MTELDKTCTDGLTKLDALRVSLEMWKHIAATGVDKGKAMEALGMCSSDYLYQCPCCEYAFQQSKKDRAGLQCKDHCPAWLEFSERPDMDAGYPCVRNPNNPFYRYQWEHPVSAEADIYREIGRGMVELLNEAYDRNLKDSEQVKF